jgi:cbb3-type cytochrome oxidase cytochrome c subunit
MHTITVNVSTGKIVQIPYTTEEQAEYDIKKAARDAGAKDRHNTEAKRQRAAAYVAETDSLFFKSQRGEATVQEWQDKIAEIKARFPYQE